MKDTKEKTITFLGVGHIIRALITGLFAGEIMKKSTVILSGPHREKFRDLGEKYQVEVTTNNKKAVARADIIFVGVRPKIMKELITEIKDFVKKDALVISLAAGVTFNLLEKYFGRRDIKVVRIMPNIPVAYGIGVVSWVGNKKITSADKKSITDLFTSLGLILEVQSEDKMDVISMVSGCGVGYVAYFMHALARIASHYGLTEDEAQKIVQNTFLGTLKHLEKTGDSSAELIEAVATKGGITEEVLQSLDKGNFSSLFSTAVQKGYAQIGRFTEELKKE